MLMGKEQSIRDFSSSYLLSICIPTYNRAEVVHECVQKLLGVPHRFFEVVVTDNCSEDETRELLEQVKDSRFRYIRNERQIGYTNLAQAVYNGKGKYALLLSDEDDLYDVDWEKLKIKLNEEEASVLNINYYGKEGELLVERLYKRLEGGSIECLMWARGNSYGSGCI